MELVHVMSRLAGRLRERIAAPDKWSVEELSDIFEGGKTIEVHIWRGEGPSRFTYMQVISPYFVEDQPEMAADYLVKAWHHALETQKGATAGV